MKKLQNVLITGGGGYVGSVLVPKLLKEGHKVKVIDLFWFGEHVFDNVKGHPGLSVVKGDIRDVDLLKKATLGFDAVIHLACISNDPSFEMNPELGKSINLDAFEPLVKISKDNGVKRFIYASSSSVYGIREEEHVTEDLSLKPLTDYSKFKAKCEEILFKEQTSDFNCITIRPATVCGYSPRLRLDLTVNIFTNLAINNGEITVFGGKQKRPNLNIHDMTNLYIKLLEYPDDLLAGKVFNAGYENHSIEDIAKMVQKVIGKDKIKLSFTKTSDIRSYHISSQKIAEELGFKPEYSIEQAVSELKQAFENGLVPNSLDDIIYYNIKVMQKLNLA